MIWMKVKGIQENMKIWKSDEGKKKKKKISISKKKEFQKRFGMISSLLMKGNTAE